MTTTGRKQKDFRDSIATADKRGKRIWIYPTKPRGKLHTARAWTAFFMLTFLFVAPFIKISGRPILLFNIIERKFFVFGITFWPQDFYLFVLFAIVLTLFIFLLTAVYGRVWCGWACPQTVFMEMVFRKIEYFIDGTARQQRSLAKQSLNPAKFFKRVIKHLIFFGISFVVGNLLLAYIIGVDELFRIITDPPSQHTTGLTFMLLFSGLFYFIFAWFREQACTLVCPYARLQSVLFDTNSIIVAYDYKRGEPRGPRPRAGHVHTGGDCIDCNACVRVCPTGIDIRNGVQLECINCTACIDVCNKVMRRVDSPIGLIRYSSIDSIEKQTKSRFTTRIILYSAALTLVTVILLVLMIGRSDIETTILRTPGSLYQETKDGMIRNLYNIKLLNKTYNEIPVELGMDENKGRIIIVGPEIVVPGNGLAESVFFVEIDKNKLFSPNSLVEVDVISNGVKLETIRTSFMGPQPKQ